MKQKVKAKDYDKGKKRVNLSLNVSDYEDLLLIAAERGIENPGTVALSILVQEIRYQSKGLKKPGWLPGQENLFKAARIKTKGKKL